ncbi:MAG: flagellar motor switch protein FliN [Phycisphaerales bacterium]
MPEERPEEQDDQTPQDARPGEAGDGEDVDRPAGEAGGPASDDDDASEALKAAKEALSSIQAEADAAIGNKAGEQPGDGGETVADSVVQAALKAAQQGSGKGSKLELPDFDLSAVSGAKHGLDMLADVQLDVRIELGRTRMLVEDVLRLNSGAVVELDKLAGDPLDVYVNDRLVARGEVLVLNDNFCIRVNEIIDSGEEVADETTV